MRTEVTVGRASSGTAALIRAARSYVSGLYGVPLRVVEIFAAWQERGRQRAMLRTIDDRLLKDMGLTPADVEVETRKPVWRR